MKLDLNQNDTPFTCFVMFWCAEDHISQHWDDDGEYQKKSIIPSEMMKKKKKKNKIKTENCIILTNLLFISFINKMNSFLLSFFFLCVQSLTIITQLIGNDFWWIKKKSKNSRHNNNRQPFRLYTTQVKLLTLWERCALLTYIVCILSVSRCFWTISISYETIC
jgi:hypothetical protein